MPQENFEKLCTKLRPVKQVAAALYYLVDEGRMRKVANYFSIGKSTISEIIRRVLFLL